jgi:hypothetical protein
MKSIICFIYVALLFNCLNGQQGVPQQAKDANSAIQRLSTFAQSSSHKSTYDHLLDDAKTAVTAADKTLPPAVQSSSNLEQVSTLLHKSLDEYTDAAIVWQAESDGKSLEQISEGVRIREKYKLPPNTNPEKARKQIWDLANEDAEKLKPLAAQS